MSIDFEEEKRQAAYEHLMTLVKIRVSEIKNQSGEKLVTAKDVVRYLDFIKKRISEIDEIVHHLGDMGYETDPNK